VVVNVAGKNQVQLVLKNGGDNIHSDHGDWADARLIRPPFCGDGIRQSAEGCDDGNASDGVCCAPACEPEPAGLPCSHGGVTGACDGEGACGPLQTTTTTVSTTTTIPPCVTGGCGPCLVCDAAIGCVPPSAPPCRLAAKREGRLTLRRDGDSRARTLMSTWAGSAATGAEDFGDPLGTTDYAICIYDAQGLQLTARAPAGGTCARRACWRARPFGFSYFDAERTPDGLRRLVLKATSSGTAQVNVVGKRLDIPMPHRPLTPPVRVQVRQGDGGACWEARFSKPVVNDLMLFHARSDF
jgi:cysteine-rich repeat protein